MFIRKAEFGGIKDRIIKGNKFGKTPRRISWQRQIELEKIEALDMYWNITHRNKFSNCSRILENKLLNTHFHIYGRLPRWNNEM